MKWVVLIAASVLCLLWAVSGGNGFSIAFCSGNVGFVLGLWTAHLLR